MPTYVYQCEYCGRRLEIFQHYSDDPLTVCPECDQPELRKAFNPTPVHFKGQGWYVKDKYNPDAAHG